MFQYYCISFVVKCLFTCHLTVLSDGTDKDKGLHLSMHWFCCIGVRMLALMALDSKEWTADSPLYFARFHIGKLKWLQSHSRPLQRVHTHAYRSSFTTAQTSSILTLLQISLWYVSWNWFISNLPNSHCSTRLGRLLQLPYAVFTADRSSVEFGDHTWAKGCRLPM